MKVHLLITQSVPHELLEEVTTLLQSYKGPIQFEAVSNSLKTSITDYTNWGPLFEICNSYRKENKISNKDYVFVLTGTPNKLDWFIGLDQNNNLNGFVQIEEWEQYLDCQPIYPVAYHIVTLLLQKYLFKTFKDVDELTHKDPIGCMNDFCGKKKEVILKLRTGDICGKCYKKLLDNNTPIRLLDQVLVIMEGIRVRMLYSQNFKHPKTVSKLIVKKNVLILKDYEGISIPLRPLEMALYILFLRHEKGIRMVDLVDYKEEIKSIYSVLSNSPLKAEIDTRINQLADLRTNSASEKISKIKNSFVKSIGKELAEEYIISGKNTESRLITLSRKKVIWD